jgi:hypothetical protein
VTTPADPLALLRSRAYVRLLVVAAILGVPISAAAWGFLALVSYLQKELFTHLPHGLGYSTAPAWWPLPMLVIGGVLIALAIRYLPGNGGASPAPGFAVHPPPAPVQLPGVILAALASLAFGAVIGPEMPRSSPWAAGWRCWPPRPPGAARCPPRESGCWVPLGASQPSPSCWDHRSQGRSC